MKVRVLETRKKSYGGIEVKWRRILGEDGARLESWELSDADFLRLIAAEAELKQLKKRAN